MAVKVEVRESESGAKDFPKLMISKSGTVVYFSEPECGTVMCRGSRTDGEEGAHSNAWHMHYFTDFHGSITLSNE